MYPNSLLESNGFTSEYLGFRGYACVEEREGIADRGKGGGNVRADARGEGLGC